MLKYMEQIAMCTLISNIIHLKMLEILSHQKIFECGEQRIFWWWISPLFEKYIFKKRIFCHKYPLFNFFWGERMQNNHHNCLQHVRVINISYFSYFEYFWILGLNILTDDCHLRNITIFFFKTKKIK